MKVRVSVQRTPVHHPKPRDDKGKPLPTNIYIDRFALCIGFLGSAILCLLGFNLRGFLHHNYFIHSQFFCAFPNRLVE